MNSQNIIIIAGMHRSGTSMTASLLEKSGLKIGKKLMSNGFDNKKGHFEDLEILKIHEEDLTAKELDTRGLNRKIKSRLYFEPFTVDKISDLIESKKHLPLWGWKEPRTTLYLDAWKTVKPNVKGIAVFRHYDDVADSLIRRYKHKLFKGISMSIMVRIKHFLIYPIYIFILRHDAYKSWYIYNSAILNFKEKYPDDMIILELNHLTRNYNKIIEEINSRFEIELSQIQVSEIVDRSLLTNRGRQKFKIRLFSIDKLNYLLSKLNKKSIWI